MFYSQFILAKKGPLGTIWIAAHLERKLKKNQVADTDIGVSVDSILFPEVPIALRLSSHLLLGVVKIYSRKVNYLFNDCSETLVKIRQAFQSTTVDLPPEESTAPYHSITLPETFDFDDLELPESSFSYSNFVDHHVTTREQITLQDPVEDTVYLGSQFGLDERFGDGDGAQVGLDFDEDLFGDELFSPGPSSVATHADEKASAMTIETPTEKNKTGIDSKILMGDDPLENDEAGTSYDREPSLGGPNQIPKSSVQSDSLQLAEAPELTYNDEDKSSLQTVVQTSITKDSVAMSSAQISANSSLISLPAGIEKTEKELFSESGNLLFSESFPVSGNVEKQPLPSANAERVLLSNSNSQSTEMTQPKFESNFSYPLSFPANAQPSLTKAYEQVTEETSTKNQVDQSLGKTNDEEASKMKNVMESESFQGTSLSVLPESISELDSTMTHGLQMSPFNESPLLAPIETFQQENMQMHSGDIAKDFSKSEDVNDLTSAIPSTLMSYQEVNQAPNPETHSVRGHDYSKDMGNYESTLTTGAQQPSSLTVIQLNDITKLQPQVPELTGASLQQTECVQNIGLLADVHKGNYSRNDNQHHEGAKSFDGAVSLQQTECVQNIGLMADVHKGNYSRNDDQYHEGAKAFDEAFSKLSGQQVPPGPYHYTNHLESVERHLQDFNKVNITHTLLDEALNNKASMSFPHAQTTMVENQTHFVPLAYSNAGTREFQRSIVSNMGTETTQQINQTTNSSQPLFAATNSQEFSKPMEINLSTFNPSTVYSSEAMFQQLGQIVEPQNLLHSDINDTNYFQRNLIGQRVENISTEENFFPAQLNLVSSSGQETATGLHHPEGSSMPLQAAADGLNLFSTSGDILNIFPSTAGMHGVFSNMQNGSLLHPCSSFQEAGKHGFNSDLSYSPSSVYLKESESAAFTKNLFTADLATITQAAQMHSSHSSDELSNALLGSELNNRVLGSYQAVSNQFQQENARLSTAIAACETLRSSVDAVNQTVIDSTDSYEKTQNETHLGDGRSPVSTLQNNSSRKRLVRESVPIFKESSSGKRRSSHSSKRTNHVAGEDDILASILGRTPSFIVKENPVETVSAKRQKTTHKTTSPKRKAVIDVAMVLQPDVIRQQLSNTEDIRRVRKKAPCTPREVWMLHWESKGPQTFYESSIAGQCPALNELYHNVCVLKGEMPQSSKTIENSLDDCQNLDSVIKEQRPEIGFSQLNSTEQSTEIVPDSAGMPLHIEHELDYTGMQIDSIEKEQQKQVILDRFDTKCNAKHIDTVYRNHSQMQPLNAVSELSDGTASLDTRKRKPTNQRVEVLDSESHGEGILCYQGKNQDETSLLESLKGTRDETDREDMSLESDRQVIVSEKETMKGNMHAGSASHDQSVDEGHLSEPVTNPLASVGDISNDSQLQENVSELNSQRPPSIEGNNMVDKDHEKNKSPLITPQTESRDLLECRVEVSYNENESNMNFSSDNIKENISSDVQNKEISFNDQNKTAVSHDDADSHLPSEIFDDHKEKSSNLIPQDTLAVFPVSHLQPSSAVGENTDNMKNIDMSNSNANVTPDTYQVEHALQQFGEKNQYSNNVGEGLKAANVEKKETDISESFNVLSNLVDERDLLQSSEFVNDANEQNQQFSMDVDLLSQEKPKTEPFQNNSDAINIALGPNKEETQVLYNVKENEEYLPEIMTEVNIETHEALQTVPPIEHESLEQRQNNEKLGDLSTANQRTTESDKTSDIKETEFVNDGLTQHSLIEQSTKQNARATAFADINVRNHDYTTEGAVRPTDFLIVEDIDDDQFVFEGNNTENAGKGQVQDNSGWSARTRAVSKYLKNTFEAMDHHSRHIYEHNKKKLGLDGLLVDKTRKEAARMFFETLVLKTRDYVHVEQENPFGDVSILPRGKLMKTNF